MVSCFHRGIYLKNASSNKSNILNEKVTGLTVLFCVHAAWYERRQMKKIYSPLLEGLLALYLGFEWIQVNLDILLLMVILHSRLIIYIVLTFWCGRMQTDKNVLAPMITHGIYSAVVLGHGLWKIHEHRRRLRQRIQEVRVEARNSNKS